MLQIKDLSHEQKVALFNSLNDAVYAVNEMDFDGLTKAQARAAYKKAMLAGRKKAFAVHNVAFTPNKVKVSR